MTVGLSRENPFYHHRQTSPLKYVFLKCHKVQSDRRAVLVIVWSTIEGKVSLQGNLVRMRFHAKNNSCTSPPSSSSSSMRAGLRWRGGDIDDGGLTNGVI